ncbi:MAG TPA: hypothetical protein VGM56_16395 [Byssovorax sp.]|jgi:plastocyanin
MRLARLVVLASVFTSLALAAAACGGGAGDKKPEGKKASAASQKPAPTGSAVIKGVVKFEGTPPPPEPWGGASNAECKRLRAEDTIQLVKVKDGKLEDAFVYVKAGLPEGTYEAPAAKIEFDQKGCEFTPRVFGVVAGETLAVTNGDNFMHNVKSPEWNQGFPFGVKKDMKLDNAAVMATIKCDVHPWMRAYAGVMDHPYFAVTKADGAFEIKGLVDGDYTVAAWHEKLGAVEAKVKATAAAPGGVDLTYKK